jgi:hypothetical protein
MQPEEREDLIPLEIPKGDFQAFLDKEGNKRIFFSGKFGTGKTFFLNEFFKDHSERYDKYHLFPVRYQIADNESIFNLLKYDLLFEIIKKYPDAFKDGNGKNGAGRDKMFFAFLKEKGFSLNNFLQSTVGAIESGLAISPDPFFQLAGKLGGSLKGVLKIDKEFQEFKKKNTKDDKAFIEDFLAEMTDNNDLVSNDYLSRLINAEIKINKGSKKSVLIIDDFDRMDPEHIFRILNVLSVHMEGDEDNKFGFDHIIIVGDVDNLKNFFYHKYGEKSNFEGYFDKFFSIEPYTFDNRVAVAEKIPLLIEAINCEDEMFKKTISNNGIVRRFLVEVFDRILGIDDVDLRQVYKLINHPFPEVSKGSFKYNSGNDGKQFVDIGIKLLIAIYGSQEKLLEILSRVKEISTDDDTDGHSFYSSRTNLMLEQMITLEVDQSTSWLKRYTVFARKSPQGNRGVLIQLEDPRKTGAKFFYETLFEYVRRSQYEKKSKYDYDW